MNQDVCRISATNALMKSINDPVNYPSGDYIDWDCVEADVFIELYVSQGKSRVDSDKHYQWYDRAVGLYIDEFGEPRLTDDKL